ncbi:hypothetical protein CAP2UW1_1051 [Candidatus Accumulibacter phosphatis]|uniref:Uncharacterized protein n=1 Tax=Accumulibacter regalis TaxID=522306 RepID=C7RQN9_ACCRE
MVFAEMEYHKHYSDFHTELLAFVGQNFLWLKGPGSI